MVFCDVALKINLKLELRTQCSVVTADWKYKGSIADLITAEGYYGCFTRFSFATFIVFFMLQGITTYISLSLLRQTQQMKFKWRCNESVHSWHNFKKRPYCSVQPSQTDAFDDKRLISSQGTKHLEFVVDVQCNCKSRIEYIINEHLIVFSCMVGLVAYMAGCLLCVHYSWNYVNVSRIFVLQRQSTRTVFDRMKSYKRFFVRFLVNMHMLECSACLAIIEGYIAITWQVYFLKKRHNDVHH